MICSAAPLIFCALLSISAYDGDALLLRQPTMSAEHVVFVYAGDLWITGVEGGDARRLTVLQAVEEDPCFSPDGRWIAFTGRYDGNLDVYVVPVEGGDPLRLTWHPGPDEARGWTPDGTRVLFRSGRDSFARFGRLFTVPREGGFPAALPLPMAESGSYDASGGRIAYTPLPDAFTTWKRYRGGLAPKIWIVDLASLALERVPRETSNDTAPAWLGGELFFLSDRNRIMNVFAYDPARGTVRQVTFHDVYDVRSLAAGPRALIYEQAGRLHTLDPATGTARTLSIRIGADLPARRPPNEKAAHILRDARISPTGKRAVIEARGEILTVPAEKGKDRNLTRTPSVHERSPAWSPDGTRIACFSESGGEYHLELRDQHGRGEPESIPLGEPASFYYHPVWSPDGKKLLYTDKRLNLSYIDLAEKRPVVVDTDTYDHPVRSLDPVWSPDSRWIAYTKRLENHFRAVFLYELEAGAARQVTDGLSDATSACFSRDGKYLFFAASTDLGLNTGWLDMSSYERPVRQSLYLAVLSSEEPSPFAHESDEEAGEEEKEGEDAEASSSEEKEEDAEGDEAAAEEAAAERTRIDLEGIEHRIVALPIPPGDYSSLQSASDGVLFYLAAREGEEAATIERFDLGKREGEPFLTDVQSYELSHDGEHVLYAAGEGVYGIVAAAGSPKLGDGTLDLASVEVRVEPEAEWAQMFDEVWRIERDFFYDPGMHGADWSAIRSRYAPLLEHVGHRADLNYVLAEMIGEMVVGHNYVGGGDQPEADAVPGGLLGADLAVDGGRYCIARIYTGESWNPELRAPLAGPGIDARVGDYVLAIDGQPLAFPDDPYRLLEHTAERPVVLELASSASGEDAREVTVVPVASEQALRNRAWVEDNRRRVRELSGGRIAYVYLPNTGGAGYEYFTRYYFSQLGCAGAVLDERFNGGGSAADYIVDLLDRPLLSYWATREGKEFTTPTAAIFGPKAMIINEFAGSGGDALPLYFRRRGLGKLVGMRTWGGLVGIYDYPVLIDGGFISAPRVAIYSPDGRWEVENEGVPPDVEVEWLPADHAAGRDPQLERAVEIVLEELAANPVRPQPRPPYPNRVR